MLNYKKHKMDMDMEKREGGQQGKSDKRIQSLAKGSTSFCTSLTD
jgi:hypothetical protein